MSAYSLQNPVFEKLIFYGAILALKMLVVALFTTYKRITLAIFSNEEDLKLDDRATKIVRDDDRVERVRRNHLNDLENIPLFLLVAGMYVGIDPSLFYALLHFRLFTLSRIIHTLAYQIPLPQPARFYAFVTGVCVIISMATQIIIATV